MENDLRGMRTHYGFRLMSSYLKIILPTRLDSRVGGVDSVQSHFLLDVTQTWCPVDALPEFGGTETLLNYGFMLLRFEN